MTDKDYAAMKAGKKTLEAIQKEKGVGKEIQGAQKAIQLPNKPIPIGKTGVKLDPSQLTTISKLIMNMIMNYTAQNWLKMFLLIV